MQEFLYSNLKFMVQTATQAGRKQPGGPQKTNEDTFAVARTESGLLAAVFDGCSSQKPIAALGEETGAHFAANFAREYTLKHTSTAPQDLIPAINVALLEVSTKLGGHISDVHSLPATTATMLLAEPGSGKLHLTHVGDTFCLIMHADGHTSLETVDRNRPYDEEIFALIRQIAEAEQISPREAKADPRVKQAVLDMFQDSYNRPDGTGQGVLNGDPAMLKYLQNTQLDLAGVKAIILGSDGLIPPDLDETVAADQAKLFEIAANGGAEALIKAKIAAEDADPDWHHTRFKHSDDATVIFVTLES